MNTSNTPAQSGFKRLVRFMMGGFLALFLAFSGNTANGALVALSQDAYVATVGAQQGVNFNTNTLNWSDPTTTVVIGVDKTLVGPGQTFGSFSLNIERTPAAGGGLIDFSTGYTFQIVSFTSEGTVTNNNLVRSGEFITWANFLFELNDSLDEAGQYFQVEIAKSSGTEQGWSNLVDNGALVDPSLGAAAGFGGNRSSISFTAVPEPSALLLGAFGSLGLFRRRRKN